MSLKDLESLINLYLNNNRLAALPENIFKFNLKLRSLVLDDNKIKTFNPTTFDSLSNLNLISISSNIISSLNSDWFKNCHRLTEFECENNKFSQIPSDFLSNMLLLKFVDFSKNPLTFIDMAIFKNNKEILKIRFKGSKDTRILNIDVFGELPKLKSIFLEPCKDRSFSDVYEELEQPVKADCATH